MKLKILDIDEGSGSIVFSKRVALSIVNGIYDPLGLVAPVTAGVKTLLRALTSMESRLGWDDPIPECYQSKWNTFLNELASLKNLTFARCIKPVDEVSNPTLITLPDASDNIFGTCCYFRWNTSAGCHKSALLMSKKSVASIKRLSIVRLELCAAVLAVRMRRFILNNCRIKIERCIHIVDSEIVRAMIMKESYGFNTFVGTRLGGIKTYSKPEEWFWLKGSENIADIITKGYTCTDIGESSEWQNGAKFMSGSIEEWPIQSSVMQQELPERNNISLPVKAEVKSCLINIERYSKYVLLLHVTARILALKREHSLMSINKPVTADNIVEAEKVWV